MLLVKKIVIHLTGAKMKHIVLCLVIFLVALLINGCDSVSTQPEEKILPVPEATPLPTHTNPVIGRVNGQPVYRDTLLDLLYQSHGQQMLDELMLLEMIRQYARSHGIEQQYDRTQKELQRLLDEMAPKKSKQNQKAILGYMLKSRGISRSQLDLILEKQSLLRELVDPNVTVTEKMIEDEFQSRYGRRVAIRQLTLGNLQNIERVKRRLEAGEDFNRLVTELSEDEDSLANGGLVGPFSKVDERIVEDIRRGAFALQQVGEISEVVSSRDEMGRPWWHLLKLEEIIAAEKTELGPARKPLRQTIHQQIIKQRMGQLQQKIKADAKTIVLDRLLKPTN